VSVLTTHFRAFEWTEFLFRRLARTVPTATVYVIDQDRSAESRARLESSGATVLTYPPSAEHIAITGHDHAYVLNRAVRDLPDGELVIFDSDCHPCADDFDQRLRNRLDGAPAVLALDRKGRSHPCFMAFGGEVDRDRLRFDAGLFDEPHLDTGRAIGEQVAGADLLPPSRGFGGRHGTVYMDAVYHHGSGSFHRSDDPRHQAALDWRDDFFRSLVLQERWTLGAAWWRYGPRQLVARLEQRSARASG